MNGRLLKAVARLRRVPAWAWGGAVGLGGLAALPHVSDAVGPGADLSAGEGVYPHAVYGQPWRHPWFKGAAAVNPFLSRYLDPAGGVRFRELVATPDADLKKGLGTLSPAERAALKARVAAFRPTLGQRLGASALGLDVDGQRARFSRLLA